MTKTKSRKAATRAKKAPAVTAFHAKTKDGDAIVGIGNLRVVVTAEDGFWFAQGLEIDYAAQGQSLEDVQNRFESGLAATINEHLRIFGDIQKLLSPAPQEIWKEFLSAKCLKKIHSQVSVHPEIHKLARFEEVEYLAAA